MNYPQNGTREERMFTAGNAVCDVTIAITGRTGELTADDITSLKEYVDFLAQNWSRPQRGQSFVGMVGGVDTVVV